MKSLPLWSVLLVGVVCPLSSQTDAIDKSAQNRKRGRPAREVLGAGTSIPARSDEFAGPFASWTNVKTAYNASGDGIRDDTTSIQKALNEVATTGHSPVLYFPAGTYKISRTLYLANRLDANLIGQDPDSTSLVWAGASGGTMLNINGLAYSKFDRLTFNGSKTAKVAVEQSWDNLKPNFDTGNEYADDIFTDVGFGIHGGFLGYGFAETSVERSHFIRNSKAGIALGNFNALDLWIWYSTFDNCGRGVTNTVDGSGAGNYHVYNSVFRNSVTADMSVGNTGGFSARGNYSRGSKQFFGPGSGTNNPSLIDIQKNIVLDTTDASSIAFGNQGPGLLMDNIIRSLPGASGPVVVWNSFVDADVTSIGNSFTVSKPISNNGRLLSIDDRIVDRSTIHPTEPVLPGTLPNLKRQILEVPVGANADVIQQVINQAAAQNGRRPVVHLPYSTYSINKTLVIPPSDLQIVGDGYQSTILQWSGSGNGPLMQLNGPTRLTLRDFEINGSGMAAGIVFRGVDQIGARVYMDQTFLSGSKQTALFVNGLDNTNIQLENFMFGNNVSPHPAVRVIGGPLLSSGAAAPGKVNIFSGASSGNTVSYDVSGGGKLLVRDTWYESGAGPGFANIHERATFTADGNRISTVINQNPPAINITNLNGKAVLVTSDLDDRIAISGSGSSAKVLGLGISHGRGSAKYFSNSAAPAARASLLNSRNAVVSILGNASQPTPNVSSASPAFVIEMLAQTRTELARPLTALPDGITDARLFRVWVTNAVINMALEKGQ